MNYFKLHSFCKFINGENAGCIYDMYTHKMIEVNKSLSCILDNAESNKELSEDDKIQLQELVGMGVGMFYDKPIYTESFYFGPNPEIKTMISPNNFIRRCFIQLTNSCELNCKFCDLNRRTSCKKWNNIDLSISMEDWSCILTQLKKIGCKELHFIGGNPFLEFSKIRQLVEVSSKLGINKFVIYTHKLFVDDTVLDFLSKYKIMIVGTIISLQEKVYRQITGENPIVVIANIERLIKNHITFVGDIVVGKFNEKEIEEITTLFSKKKIPYKLNFIYDKPDNDYYSKKLLSKMYDKRPEFGVITKESISFLGEYNSCLYGQIYINISGNITPCPMMNDYTIGNIWDNGGITSVINNPKYQNVIKMSRNQIKSCSGCPYRLNCFDCRAVEYTATGKIDGQRYCGYLKESD